MRRISHSHFYHKSNLSKLICNHQRNIWTKSSTSYKVIQLKNHVWHETCVKIFLLISYKEWYFEQKTRYHYNWIIMYAAANLLAWFRLYKLRSLLRNKKTWWDYIYGMSESCCIMYNVAFSHTKGMRKVVTVTWKRLEYYGELLGNSKLSCFHDCRFLLLVVQLLVLGLYYCVSFSCLVRSVVSSRAS